MGEFIENFMNVVKNHYFDPNGRARRQEFWRFVAVVAVVNIVFGILMAILGSIAAVLGTIVYLLNMVVSLALLLPNVTLSIRRLHDVEKSGWFLLLAFVPLANFYLIYLFCIEGTKGDNEFGADPKAGITE